MMYFSLEKIKKSLRVTLFVLLGFGVTFILSVIANLIFGEFSDELMNYNPIFNGFIHADPTHLLHNLAMVFIFMLFNINQDYSLREFYVITVFISILSFPVSLTTGIPAVGISGTLYFMMARACLNSRNVLMYLIVGGSLIYEVFHMTEISDGIAHYVHVIGSILGAISLKSKTYLKFQNSITYKIKNQIF